MKKRGIQLYTVRDYMTKEQNIKELFQDLKAAGYDEVEIFGNIENMLPALKCAAELDLEIAGTICNLNDYSDREKTVKWCRDFGIKCLGVSASEFASAGEVEKFIQEANQLSRVLSQYGLSISYHNHSHEFRKYEFGKTAFERMVDELDHNIGFVLDTYWVQHGGGDVRHWLDVLGNRITTLHMKDMKRIENNQVTYAPLGEGNLWWEGIIAKAEEIGVRHFIVEQDECDGDSLECAKRSIAYIKKYLN